MSATLPYADFLVNGHSRRHLRFLPSVKQTYIGPDWQYANDVVHICRVAGSIEVRQTRLVGLKQEPRPRHVSLQVIVLSLREEVTTIGNQRERLLNLRLRPVDDFVTSSHGRWQDVLCSVTTEASFFIGQLRFSGSTISISRHRQILSTFRWYTSLCCQLFADKNARYFRS